MKDIWLISHSPRRQQLLRDLGLEFRIGEAHVEEVYPEDLAPEEIPVYLSRLKADAAAVEMTDDTLIITADTIVWADGRVLGKPADEAEARAMLQLLSGKTHQVVTGVTLRTKQGSRSFFESTDVTFATLSDADIEYYVTHYRPFDKAGAYGIQEWIGMVGVESIRGCFYNVMGLPVHRLYREIKFLK
ncbi:MAG: septum formation protein Maf [Bacteroidaceae bacterium]|nr:septum formation protein Maf [Bacteroidaceae bacterium]MBP5731547.1 septum formation protein Maf [Bacteroidaceae bacterium]